jgi:hypothetical protein
MKRPCSFAVSTALVVACGGSVAPPSADASPEALEADCGDLPEVLEAGLEERRAAFCGHVTADQRAEGLATTIRGGSVCCARKEGGHREACAVLGGCPRAHERVETTRCEEDIVDGRYAYFHCSGGWVCCAPR